MYNLCPFIPPSLQTKDIQRKRDEITTANRELSLANTDRRPVFEQKKQELIDGSLKASELKEEYDRKHEQLSKCCIAAGNFGRGNFGVDSYQN